MRDDCGVAGPLVGGKEQRAKEEQVLAIDIDTIQVYWQYLTGHTLRIYCCPMPTPFSGNTDANCFNEVAYSKHKHS